MLSINNNMMALTASNNLLRSYGSLGKSIDALSSGLRVKGAADDAAGLAVRELFRADIAALNQGVRNANDAISLLQIMDGAAAVINEKLIRLKELAEQAATGTYSSAQRAIMQQEFTQMLAEIDRIAKATRFNDIRLLHSASQPLNDTMTGLDISAAGGVKIHFGPANRVGEDYYGIESRNMTSAGLGLDTTRIGTQHDAQDALSAINTAIGIKDAGRAHFGAMMNRLENTATVLTLQSENLQAAESRISDVDVAREMTRFMSLQIKSQAAVAMLSQANVMPQMALQLLGG